MSPSKDLRDLIAAAREGDEGARGRLVELHRDALDHYLRLRIGAHLRARVEVEDVFQDTFASAFASLDSFHWAGEGSFRRWLQRIAENRILALAKKTRRNEVLLVENAPDESPDTSPSVSLRRDERFDRLRAALDRLDPDYREVIVLARLEGLRLADVAERMGRSPNAVAHLLSRALVQLRTLFGDTESLGLPARPLHRRTESEHETSERDDER